MATVLKVQPRFSEAEWKVRVDLAAFYRLAALHGWDDLIFTHISARVPGPEHHFLINPYGMMFEEITASSLVKVTLDGTIVGESEYGINYAGYVIHSAVHGAREDARFVIHFHTKDGVAVSAQTEGLLPLNQRALIVIPHLAYHEYEGIAFNLEEQERLVVHLGNNKMMMLRNHGTLALGASAGEAWMNIYELEAACTAQVRTLSAGRAGIRLASETAQEEVRKQMEALVAPSNEGPAIHELVWEAALRKAKRHSPGFDS